MKIVRFVSTLVLIAPLLIAVAANAADDKKPVGTVEISSTTFAIGIGGSWGDGILILNDGSQHPFSVRGFDVGALGYATATAKGEVYDLKKVEDFAGKYSAVTAGGAVVKGAEVTSLQNAKGVIIALESTKKGLQLNVGAKGIEFKLEK